MKHLCILFMLILSLDSNTHAQQNFLTALEVNNLDSLMSCGDFEGIKNFLVYKDSTILNKNLDKKNITPYNKSKKQYIAVIESLISLDTSSVGQYIQQYRKFADRFEKRYAGQKAFSAYQKFLSLSQTDKLQAIKFYRIAYFFKIKYLQNVQKNVRSILALANNLYNQKDFDKALKIIDSAKFEFQNNPALIILSDSLKYLQTKVAKQIELKESYQQLWQQK